MRQIIILICQKKNKQQTQRKRKNGTTTVFFVFDEKLNILYTYQLHQNHTHRNVWRDISRGSIKISGFPFHVWIVKGECHIFVDFQRKSLRFQCLIIELNILLDLWRNSYREFLWVAKSSENQSRFFRILFYSVDLRWRKKWNQSRNKRISYQSNLIKSMLFLYFAFLWFLSERHKKICQLHKFLKEQIKKHWKMWKNVFNVKSNIVVLKVQQQKTVKKLAFSSQFQ